MSPSSGESNLQHEFSKLLIQQRKTILGSKYEDEIMNAAAARVSQQYNNSASKKHEDKNLIHHACLINYNSIKINIDDDNNLQKSSSSITSIATKATTQSSSSYDCYSTSNSNILVRDSSSQSAYQQNSSIDIESDTASDESVFEDGEIKQNYKNSLQMNDEKSSSSSSSSSSINEEDHGDEDYIYYIDGYLFENYKLK
jgi:hypothetical protein